MPIDPVAQIGKGLAQGRLDLEPLFLRRDHSRGQLQAQADLDARLALRLRGDDLEPDEFLAEASKMRFKLPHLFLDDLRRALLAVPVEIAKRSYDFHAVKPSCRFSTKQAGATVIAPASPSRRHPVDLSSLDCTSSLASTATSGVGASALSSTTSPDTSPPAPA